MEHSEQAACGQRRALWRCPRRAEAIMDHDEEYAPPARYVGPIAELRGRQIEATRSPFGLLVSWVDDGRRESPVRCLYVEAALKDSPAGRAIESAQSAIWNLRIARVN